jgi:phosphate transport system protein
MTRIPTLDLQLSRMRSLLRSMCDRVLAGLTVVIEHLETPRHQELIKIVVLDTEVDNLETEIDEAILQIFATQQPMAYELRLVYATAKIAHHVERIGDAVESLARQLAGRDSLMSKDLIGRMMRETKDLYTRSYMAMFEGDLTQIADIHLLDDKIDTWHRELFQRARRVLHSSNERSAVEEALQVINVSSKLEKIADLCCNWAEQIDFAEHGLARRTLRKRKHRVVFVDEEESVAASLAASYLQESLHELFDITVVTRSDAASQGALAYSDLLAREKVTPQAFPVAKLASMRWSRTLMLITLGDCSLTEAESEAVPHKTVRLCWPEITLAGQDAETLLPKLRARVEDLSHVLARTRR